MPFSSSQSSHPSHHPMSGHHATVPPPALVDHHPTTYPPSVPVVSPPGDNPSPPYTHHTSAHSTAQPINFIPPSTYTHQLGHSMYQDYSSAEQPTHRIERHLYPNPYLPAPATIIPCPQQPPHLAQSPFPSGLYPPPHPATHPYPPISYPVHSLPGFQSRSGPQFSATIYPPEFSIDEAHQQPHWNPQGLISSTSSGPEQSHQPHYQNQGMFSGSHHLSFSDNTFIDNSTAPDSFMKDFLQHTIIGAEYDSSARDPPPRCHPGTRLAIVGRCKAFIDECDDEEKMRWVVGPAGVGKSAIMQMVAEETPADASVFISVNGRQDGTKTFTTIAYQLAAKYEPYRQFVRNEITRDPSLLRKALPVQFQKFIVDPFVARPVFDLSCRFVIIIDGLDECDSPLVQRQLLELISRFCISRPTSPIVWFIASRPEPHITSFFERTDVQPAYTKEEIAIDSDEAYADVQRYLREELNEIKLAYPTLEHKREWPSELEFTKIATAAGGLFAYASTVIRHIDDPYYGDPASQLDDVIAAIDRGFSDETSRNNNPLALLDALYARIISKIPDSSVVNARKILLLHSSHGNEPEYNFRMQCNRLGLTEDAAYGAVRHLRAVVKVPLPHRADDEALTFCHKSFEDFLFDPLRSKFCCSAADDVVMLKAQISSRVLEQTQVNFDCMALDESIACYGYGDLKAGPRLCDNILLSWPGDERFSTTDDELRCELYAISMDNICSGFRYNNNFFWTMTCFHALTTRFTTLEDPFPFGAVRDFVFDGFRAELMDLGKLKQVPVRTLGDAAICGMIEIQLTCPVGMYPWHPNCTHKGLTKINESSLQIWDFSTFPKRSMAPTRALNDSHRISAIYGPSISCLHCSQRLTIQLINNPDQLATVFVDATDMCYVEWTFVDPDGVSEWRYRFCHPGALVLVN